VTLGDWLRDRTPVPPPRLAARLEQSLGERCQASETQAPELCIAAAEELLGGLLARETTGRESALDLLTVDALVTYAFEAAAADPETLAHRAQLAMTRLSAAAR
jgi:hypothetical protein